MASAYLRVIAWDYGTELASPRNGGQGSVSQLSGEVANEIRLGEWQNSPGALLLRDVLRANRGELSARDRNAALLLRSQVLSRPGKTIRSGTSISGESVMMSADASTRIKDRRNLNRNLGSAGVAVLDACYAKEIRWEPMLSAGTPASASLTLTSYLMASLSEADLFQAGDDAHHVFFLR